MANDNKASYFRIGLMVLMGSLAIAGILIYIGGLRGRGNVIEVETYYDRPVGGLSVGSAVNFRGVKIGEVCEISFIGAKYEVEGLDNTRIYIRMALNRDMIGDDQDSIEEDLQIIRRYVAVGLRATVSSSAITGLSLIEFDFYRDDPLPPKPSWKPRCEYIPPKVSLLESFSESATKVMNQINRMDLNAFWSNINASAESISAMTLSSRHLLESYQPELERMVKNLEEASSSVRTLVDEVGRNPSSLIRGRVLEPLPETER